MNSHARKSYDMRLAWIAWDEIKWHEHEHDMELNLNYMGWHNFEWIHELMNHQWMHGRNELTCDEITWSCMHNEITWTTWNEWGECNGWNVYNEWNAWN